LHDRCQFTKIIVDEKPKGKERPLDRS